MSKNLDKYLPVKKKKVKNCAVADKKKYKGGGLRIVDEEEDFNKGESTDDETVEELPQIAAVVDDRPRHMQLEEEMRKGKWKTMTTIQAAEDSRKREGKRSYSEDEDASPPSKKRHDSDESIPRKNRKRQDSDDLSPPRRRRNDSGDLSPPRRRRHDSGDLSPPRRRRHDSGGLSPPRRRRHDSGDLSPPRRRRNDSEDLSPPRRRRHDSGDLSPPRRRRNDSDESIPRLRKNRKPQGSQDLSPPRRRGNNAESRRPISNPVIIETPEESVTGTTLEGKKAGLQKAADLRKEMVDYRKRENAMFANLDDEVSGRTAVTKLRDRATGKERDLAAEIAKKEAEDKLAIERKKLYDNWGKGMKQVEERSNKLNEALHEISKPLARYADDADLDDYLKKQIRDGDPMLKYIAAQKKSKPAKDGANSGSVSDRPTYQGSLTLPNRFGINPGYRWDGVDRSNGYEKEWFSRINTKTAFRDEAYKWSVEDL